MMGGWHRVYLKRVPDTYVLYVHDIIMWSFAYNCTHYIIYTRKSTATGHVRRVCQCCTCTSTRVVRERAMLYDYYYYTYAASHI